MSAFLGGARAMTLARPSTSSRAAKVSNGTKWTMKRKDSYMVEVQVGEDESEDQAVRNFMKSVVSSGVIDQLRARRHKESKIEEYKRKLQARALARRLGIIEPTWEELHSDTEHEPKAFDDFFGLDEDGGEIFADLGADGGMGDLNMLTGYAPLPQYADGEQLFDLATYEQQGAGYMDAQAQQGGYIDQQPAGNGFQ